MQSQVNEIDWQYMTSENVFLIMKQYFYLNQRLHSYSNQLRRQLSKIRNDITEEKIKKLLKIIGSKSFYRYLITIKSFIYFNQNIPLNYKEEINTILQHRLDQHSSLDFETYFFGRPLKRLIDYKLYLVTLNNILPKDHPLSKNIRLKYIGRVNRLLKDLNQGKK